MLLNNVRRAFIKNNGPAVSMKNMMAATAGRSQQQGRGFATLILAEHLEGDLNTQVGSCLKAANDLADPDVSFCLNVNLVKEIY